MSFKMLCTQEDTIIYITYIEVMNIEGNSLQETIFLNGQC